MTEVSITKTLFLKAPPEHVWKFLTKAEYLALWFHKGRTDLHPNEDYVLETNTLGQEGDALIWGKVLEMKEPERLVHTFTHKWLKGVETTCTWTLTPVPPGTMLTLVHSGGELFTEDPFTMAADHDAGWDEHFIRLRQVTR